MIKVSVFYALRRVLERLPRQPAPSSAAAVRSIAENGAVEEELTGATPGSAPAFVAMGYFVFDSFQAFEASFGRHGDKIVADVVNYTKVQLLIQISLIKLQGSERSGNSRQPLQP